MTMPAQRLIEADCFPFEFISTLAQRESWRKEIHRPIYHIHKWWAKRLGSVFRGLVLGCQLGEDEDLTDTFYRSQEFSDFSVFDPFMGSGTTLGEAHKLGFAALGRDINPVAVEAVRVALGSLQAAPLEEAFTDLSKTVGARIRLLYRTECSQGLLAQVLYYFWVMRAPCPACHEAVDLFSSWVRARNAYPRLKPEVKVLCPSCDAWFKGLYAVTEATCPACNLHFNPTKGTVRGANATCRTCEHTFSVREAVAEMGACPSFRLYGKLILTKGGAKEYLPATVADQEAYQSCVEMLSGELKRDSFRLPTLKPTADTYEPRALYLSCGDSSSTGLAAGSVDLVLTDPPFFDNVHYSELADFFYAWQQLTPRGFINGSSSTRAQGEVQDTDPARFAVKLRAVFLERYRVLKPEGLLVFTYHHSRDEGWAALAEAVLGAGFIVVNAHPLKSEMSVATPKAQTKEPIQLDIAIVCRKASPRLPDKPEQIKALLAAQEKLSRLESVGFKLSRNDERAVLFGQLLTTIGSVAEIGEITEAVENTLNGSADVRD